MDYLKLAGKMRRLSPQGNRRRWSRSSPRARRIFWTSGSNREQVKVTLATDGVIGANGGPRSPGTAYILLHHCMGGVGGHRGLWGFVRGGMGAVSEAIAASARAKGVEIRTNAPVAKVLVRGGRARGVVLENGEEIEAAHGRVEPRSQADVPAAAGRSGPARRVRRAIRNFRIEGTSCKINLALSGLPEFTRLARRAGPAP